jgi:hypothetical protein
VRCKTCHFPFKEVTEPRCPNCGREFDQENLPIIDPAREPVLLRDIAMWPGSIICVVIGLAVILVLLLR